MLIQKAVQLKTCIYLVGIIFTMCCGIVTPKVFYNVTCGSSVMQVTLNLTSHPSSIVYLQNLKGYPGCDPVVKTDLHIFHLSLNDSGAHCGVSKMLNKQTGHNIFYHRVVIEKKYGAKEKELLFVQCVIPGDFNMDFVRLDWIRESLPYNYTTQEPSPSILQDLIPYVNIAIRDKGQQLDTSTIVKPGSLLDLLIYLDKEPSAHFDISVRYLTLADGTGNQEEVVVMNGCPVDPFVLEVLGASEGGVLRSQFRAFKFHGSSLVLFLATVSVCLQRCVQTDCYSDTGEGGRRKREIPKFLPHYSNEAYEVQVSALLRLQPHPLGEIILEDSTNDTLDTMYDTEYSGDFPEQIPGDSAASCQPPTRQILSSLLAVTAIFAIVTRTLIS